MKKYIFIILVIVLAAALIVSFKTSAQSTTLTGGVVTEPLSLSNSKLSLVRLPAAGYIDLTPLNNEKLVSLGLGGPSPESEPPVYPYNQNGMYWSTPFSLVEGDTVQVTVYSDSPVSWFGIDWKNLNVRGIVATTETDEDGKSFNPQYPVSSSVEKVPNGYKLTANYKIPDDTDCVLVLKNTNTGNSPRISLNVALQPSVSFKRILRNIPVLKNLVKSESYDGDD
jgi:hypothetical protein